VDAIPLFLVALTFNAAAPATDLMFARTLLRSMRGSLPAKLAHSAAGLACVTFGLLLSAEPPDRIMARLVISGTTLGIVTVLFHVFLSNVARYDRSLGRERVLAQVSGELTGRVDQQRICEVAIGAATRIVGEVVAVAVALGPRDRLHVIATTEDLHPAIGAVLRHEDGEVRLAQPSQPQANFIAALLDAPRASLCLFPITARDELYGVLLVDVPEQAEHGVHVALKNLCSSAGMALANAVLTQELTKLAFHDSLTRLANRALLSEQTDTALARTARGDGAVALLVLDLDGFKRINDEFGHRAGDEALVIVAARLLDQVREGDVVARLGGDEFGVLLADLHDASEATAVARRILGALGGPLAVGEDQIPVGASIGIAVWPCPAAARGAKKSRQGPLPRLDDLLHDADTVMYVAKSRGSGYEVFPGSSRSRPRRVPEQPDQPERPQERPAEPGSRP
jgi:diguanylate cyclase (GGDEF)-like protein